MNIVGMLDKIETSFRQKGWFVLTLADAGPVRRARQNILDELHRAAKDPALTLENYHESFPQDEEHTRMQLHLTEYFRQNHLGPEVIRANADFFKSFIGPDINVQSNPYLRIVRPGKPQDNVGFHRDTFYGGSPYELSVWIPLVDIDASAALSVISGSHVSAEADFPTTQIQNPDPLVTKGSPKSKLGFLYAPKIIHPSKLKDAVPVPLRVGEALVFSLSLTHGTVENRSAVSRWSADVRVVNALASFDLSSRPDYYHPLCRSAVTEKAAEYLQANLKNPVN